MYDPFQGRFLSPDPYVQDPLNPLNHNRYAYCLNNPLKYTDPSGYNWFKDTGDWLGDNGKMIVTTAVTIGVVVGVTAVIVASGGTLAPVAIAAIAGGAGGFVGGILGTALNGGTGKDYVVNGALGLGIGALTGMAGYGAGQWGANIAKQGILKFGSSAASPMLNGMFVGGTAGAIGGSAAGFLGGFTGTLIMTGDIDQALASGWDGMKMGAIFGFGAGAASGGYGGYKYAKDNGLNPWTGRSLSNKSANNIDGSVDLYSEGLSETIKRIDQGGKFPHRNDGSVFKNYPPKGQSTPLLPEQPTGYYREYVHPTPGIEGPGMQRVIYGNGGDIYYTPDHYSTFIKIR